jgi:hypothetical protein
MINFEATLKALSDRGVNFVVISGYAATFMVQRISHETSTSATSARRKTSSGWCPRLGLIIRACVELLKACLFFLTWERFPMA